MIGAYVTRVVDRYFMTRLEHELKTETSLVSELVRESLLHPADPAALRATVAALGHEIGVRITVVDASGAVLADTDHDPATLDNHATRPEILQALQTGVGTAIRYSASLKTRLWYAAVRVTSEGTVVGFVRLAVPLAQVDESIGAIRRSVLKAGLIALAAAFILSILVARSVGGPIKDMADAARQMACGDFHRRIPVRGRDELGQLAEAFNHMAVELERSIGELSERKDRMEAILSVMADGVLAVDRSGKILLANSAASRILGISEHQAFGRHLLEVVRNHELAESLQSATRGEPDTREVTLREPRLAHLMVHSAPIPERGTGTAAGAVAVLQDLTELRRLERVRTEFVSNVSHELRTPLTSVKGFVDTLLDGAMEDRDTLRRFLEIISKETDRLASIISDLLELSRLESGGTQVRKSPVSLGGVIDAALGVVRERASEKGIAVDVRIPSDLPPVPGDEALLVQVLVNLLDNAVKYTPEHGHVEVAARRQPDGSTRVDVSDTGIGIPAEHLPRVFERFYRVDRARSRQLGGTGLGLSIVKHIIERHGGTVSVSSTPGMGSIFSFVLPPT